AARHGAPRLQALLDAGAVAARDAAVHHREPQRLASGFAGGGVDDLAALARLIDTREDRVVLVRPAHRGAHRARLRGAADDDRRARLLHRLRPDVIGLR